MITLKARSIAIVGAGPSGIIAAKYLQAEKAFDKIVLFEQRSRTGGIWNYTGDQKDEELFRIPQTNPHGENQDPTWRDATSKSTRLASINGADRNSSIKSKASFLSPIYKRLETNIPRGLMGFQDLNWPESSQLFPTHETVLQYIEDYGKDVQDLIYYETQVTDIRPADDIYGGEWTVLTRNLRDETKTEEVFDAVIVANGHFIVPCLPKISGIKEWSAKFPGSISHSKYYRQPEDFAGKKVVVVGNSASGSDISRQICQYSRHPLLWSSRSPSLFSTTASASPQRRELPPISKFLPESQGVEFEGGTVETDVDAVLFATGYFYSLPFLENVRPKLITDGSHVNHTYQHIFYTPRPTLSFLALNQRVIPFPVAEAQASVLARVYSGRLSLPPLSTMQAWEQKIIEEMGNGRNFHLLPFPKDGIYINEMSNWALTAAPQAGLENDGKGKIPPIWGDKEFWCRETFAAIRLAFGALGEDRHKVTSLEEVGFSYEEYLKKRASEEGKLV